MARLVQSAQSRSARHLWAHGVQQSALIFITVWRFVVLFNSETWASCSSFLSRPGQLLRTFCTPESLERLRKTLVSVCALSDACMCVLNAPHSMFVGSDTDEVRSAFDVLMQCRMLPMLLESFVGASLIPWHDGHP